MFLVDSFALSILLTINDDWISNTCIILAKSSHLLLDLCTINMSLLLLWENYLVCFSNLAISYRELDATY